MYVLSTVGSARHSQEPAAAKTEFNEAALSGAPKDSFGSTPAAWC